MLFRKRYKPKSETQLQAHWHKLKLEKGDVPAMLLAALLTLLPVVLLVGGVFFLVIWALFLR